MSPSRGSLPVDWVTSDAIRKEFNERGLYPKSLSGELSTKRARHSHLKNPPDGEPFCTHSQILYYYDMRGYPVAVVHQYLRPDGTIGASGLPDPKKLILDDRILAVRGK